MKTHDHLPWYKHRWPWLLMLGPAIVAIACIFTIRLAFQHQDEIVVSKEAMHGLVVNIDKLATLKNGANALMKSNHDE